MPESRKKIAVVCADLPDRNTGMVTVDLAAHTIINRMFPQAEVTIYSLGRGGKSPYAPGETTHGYRDIIQHAAGFLASDVYLYWGDFIHSCAYWELDMKKFNNELAGKSDEERAALLNRQEQERSRLIFMSSQSAQDLKRAIVFGSTIITNEATDIHAGGYMQDFERFFAGVGAVYFRDALSAAKVSPLRGQQATLACDCAFLLENEDLKQLAGFAPASRQEGIGVFFGRSPKKLQMLQFARQVGAALDMPCRWLPWFASNAKMRMAGRFFGYDIPREDWSPGAILSALSGCRFVVTDTYHICINAWRMGIPAICVGEGANVAYSSVADKKKEIAYEMYGARRLYIFLEKICSSAGRRTEAQRVAQVLRDQAVTGTVCQNVQAHRGAALLRLQRAVEHALEFDGR